MSEDARKRNCASAIQSRLKDSDVDLRGDVFGSCVPASTWWCAGRMNAAARIRKTPWNTTPRAAAPSGAEISFQKIVTKKK